MSDRFTDEASERMQKQLISLINAIADADENASLEYGPGRPMVYAITVRRWNRVLVAAGLKKSPKPSNGKRIAS